MLVCTVQCFVTWEPVVALKGHVALALGYRINSQLEVASDISS